MTTTRALAVAAYVAAVASPVAADWRAVADMLHAALPAVRGSASTKATDPNAIPAWFADWKLGKVYSLASVDFLFADAVRIRVNLANAPGKLPRIAAACRVAVAFYRAQTGEDAVPAFARIATVGSGAEFDPEACSRFTADLRRTAIVPRAVRPAVTAESFARMERELMRRRAGLANAESMPDRIAAFHIPLCLSWDWRGRAEAELRGMKESAAMADGWRKAVADAEAELDAMRAALDVEPVAAEPSPLAVVAMAPCEAEAPPAEPVAAEPSAPAAEPVAAMPEPVAVPCEAEPAGPVPAVPAVPAVAAEPVAVAAPVAVAPLAVAVAAEPGPAGNDDAPVPPMPGAPAPAVAPLAVEASTVDPVEAIRTADPVEAMAEPCAHLEPMALCPANGMPCTLSCGYRPGCGVTVAEAVAAAEAEPVAALCSDDDAPAMPGPVTVLCLSHKSRAAILSRTGGRAVPEAGHSAKGGAFRISLADAAACAGIKSVRFIGLPRKAYTRAAAPVRPPVVGIPSRTPVVGILADVAPVAWVRPIIAGMEGRPVVTHAACKL